MATPVIPVKGFHDPIGHVDWNLVGTAVSDLSTTSDSTVASVTQANSQIQATQDQTNTIAVAAQALTTRVGNTENTLATHTQLLTGIAASIASINAQLTALGGVTVPQAPTSVHSTATTSTTLTMALTAPGAGSAATSYQWYYRTPVGSGAYTTGPISAGVSVTITGLVPGTAYGVTAAGINSAGTGAQATEATATTSASGTITADGTQMPPATSLTDKNNIVWTIVGGVLQKGGVADTSTSGVVLGVIANGGVMYQQNSAGNWWLYNPATTTPFWVSTTSPLATGVFLANLAVLTGKNAQQAMFGIAVNAGNDGFGSMTTGITLAPADTSNTCHTWASGLTKTGGFGICRVQAGGQWTGPGGVWPTRASWNGNTPNWTQLDFLWTALKQVNGVFPGGFQVMIGLGDGLIGGASGGNWLDPSNTADLNILAQVAVKIHQRWVANGGPTITHWESINEPDSFMSTTNVGFMCQALFAALRGAGFNTVSVGGPAIANTPAFGAPHSGHIEAVHAAMGANQGFVSAHMYSNVGSGVYTAGDGPARVLSAFDPTNGYAALENICVSAAGGGLPFFCTEFNLYGLPTNEVDQLNNLGGIYFALGAIDQIVNSNGGGMTWWLGSPEDFPGVESYAMINGAAQQTIGGYAPGFIYPVAWIIGWMNQHCIGKVVSSPSDTTLKIKTMAIVDAGTGVFKAFVLVNYGSSAQTLNVQVSSAPTTVSYFEISGANQSPPAVSTKTAAQLQTLSIPAFSFVGLSP